MASSSTAPRRIPKAEEWEELSESETDDHRSEVSSPPPSLSKRRIPVRRLGPTSPSASSRVKVSRNRREPDPPSRQSTPGSSSPLRRRKVVPESPSPKQNGSLDATIRRSQSKSISHSELQSQRNHGSSYIISILSSTTALISRLILFLISLGSSILAPYLLPLILGVTSILLTGTTLYFLLPRLPSFLIHLGASALRRLLPASPWSSLLASDITVLQSAAIVPARILATPACALFGAACQYSVLSTFRPGPLDTHENGDQEITGDGAQAQTQAQPFWKWDWTPLKGFSLGSTIRSDVDVAGIARGLSREVKQARDIFESVQNMGSAGLVRNLHYVKIWELGTAVSVGSNLEKRGILGEELKELGDITRDLADEIMGVDHAAVNAFTWIQWEFSTLLDLLDSPNPPSNLTLSTRLHSLISQLDSAFTELHLLTSVATSTASSASSKGSSLYKALSEIRHSLLSERDRDPIWRQAWDKNKHRLVGGEVPRSEMLERDISLTGDTILSLHDAKEHLERVRIMTKGYRDQIGLTQARMVGFHLGAEGAGVEAEEEVRVLGRLVEGLGEAVSEAKRKERGEGLRGRRKGYREIEA